MYQENHTLVLTNKMRLNEKSIADPSIKNIFLTIDDDSEGSFPENEEGQRETKFSRSTLDKLKIKKNKRSKKIEKKTPELEESNQSLEKGDLEPHSFIPIEEDEHDAPETCIEEHVISSQPSQGKNILNLPYSDSEDSELEKDQHKDKMPVQEAVIMIQPSNEGDEKTKKMQKRLKKFKGLIKHLRHENVVLRRKNKKVMEKKDKLATKHNKLCDWAQKIYQNNGKLFRQGRKLKRKWLQEKLRNQDRDNLKLLAEVVQSVL
jgi:hypothetical protein